MKQTSIIQHIKTESRAAAREILQRASTKKLNAREIELLIAIRMATIASAALDRAQEIYKR